MLICACPKVKLVCRQGIVEYQGLGNCPKVEEPAGWTPGNSGACLPDLSSVEKDVVPPSARSL